MAQNTAAQILKLMSDNDFVGFIGLSTEPIYITDSHNNSIKVKYNVLIMLVYSFTAFITEK